MKRLVALACVGLAAAGLCARLSAAAFTGSTAISSNTVTVDQLNVRNQAFTQIGRPILQQYDVLYDLQNGRFGFRPKR